MCRSSYFHREVLNLEMLICVVRKVEFNTSLLGSRKLMLFNKRAVLANSMLIELTGFALFE